MAGETVTLISYIAAHIAEQDKNPKLAKLLRKLGAAAFAASLPFAAHATCTYIKRAVKGNAEKEKPRQIIRCQAQPRVNGNAPSPQWSLVIIHFAVVAR